MKLKQFECPVTGILMQFDEAQGVYVAEDSDQTLTVEAVEALVQEGKIAFTEDDVIIEADDEKKKKAEDEDDEELDEEAEDEEDEDDDEDDEELAEESFTAPELDLDYKVELSEEDRAALGGDQLSEEAQSTLVTVFEAAVTAKVKAIAATVQEAYADHFEKKLEEAKDGINEQINDYLEYAVNEWSKENEVAIENGLKNELNEKFLEGLAALFKEHYIEVPENRYDILEGLANKVEELESKLDESIKSNIQLKKGLSEVAKVEIAKELSEGLADTQKEKFFDLLDSVTTEDVNEFKTKASQIRESYFGKSVAPTEKPEENVNEDVDDKEETPLSEREKRMIEGAMRLLN